MSTDIKLSKAQISKIIKNWIAIIKINHKTTCLLGLTAASSVIDAGAQKKIYGAGTTTLVISNEEMNEKTKIVQTLENSGILLKGATETMKNETKEHKGGFLSMLLGTLGASLLGDL